MKANTCLLLLVIGWFFAGLPIALVVFINSLVKIVDTNNTNDKIKYGISIAVSIVYFIIFISYYL